MTWQRRMLVMLAGLAVAFGASLASAAEGDAAPPDGGRGPRPRPPLPPSPLLRALDADGDGVISAEEIANAPAALKKLDKNGDGKLTPDELVPPRRRPDGQGGQGGPDGGGRRDGPRGGQRGGGPNGPPAGRDGPPPKPEGPPPADL